MAVDATKSGSTFLGTVLDGLFRFARWFAANDEIDKVAKAAKNAEDLWKGLLPIFLLAGVGLLTKKLSGGRVIDTLKD